MPSTRRLYYETRCFPCAKVGIVLRPKCLLFICDFLRSRRNGLARLPSTKYSYQKPSSLIFIQFDLILLPESLLVFVSPDIIHISFIFSYLCCMFEIEEIYIQSTKLRLEYRWTVSIISSLKSSS